MKKLLTQTLALIGILLVGAQANAQQALPHRDKFPSDYTWQFSRPAALDDALVYCTSDLESLFVSEVENPVGGVTRTHRISLACGQNKDIMRSFYLTEGMAQQGPGFPAVNTRTIFREVDGVYTKIGEWEVAFNAFNVGVSVLTLNWAMSGSLWPTAFYESDRQLQPNVVYSSSWVYSLPVKLIRVLINHEDEVCDDALICALPSPSPSPEACVTPIASFVPSAPPEPSATPSIAPTPI